MAKRSSYRLGRRLKSSAKARLDYITYLQSVGGKAKGEGPTPVPPVPGPFDFIVDELGLTTITLPYDLAGSNALFGLAFRFDGDPIITATHGGEALTITRADRRDDPNVMTVLMYGTGLTPEGEDLVITVTGGTIGPVIGRVNDEFVGNPPEIKVDWVGGENGFAATTNPMVLVSTEAPGTFKGVHGYVSPGNLSNPLPAPQHERVFAAKVVAGAWGVLDDWNLSDGWANTPEGLEHQGQESTIRHLLPNMTGPLGVRLEVTVAATAKLWLTYNMQGGGFTRRLYQGPLDTTIYDLSEGYGNPYTRVDLTAQGDVLIKAVDVAEEAIHLSASFSSGTILSDDGDFLLFGRAVSGPYAVSAAHIVGIDPTAYLAADMGLGGAFGVDLKESTYLAVGFDLGGAFDSIVAVTQEIGAEHSLGGEMRAHIFPPTVLAINMQLGGEQTTGVKVVKTLSASMGLGGSLVVNAAIRQRMVVRMALEGAMVAKMGQPHQIKVGFALGGTFELNLKNTDDDVAAIIAAMTPTPDSARQMKIQTLVLSLKSSGVWEKLGALYLFYAHSKQATKINWKSPGTFDCVEIGAVSWAEDNYIQGATGANGYDTQYNLSSGGALTPADAHLLVYPIDYGLLTTFDCGTNAAAWVGTNINATPATSMRVNPLRSIVAQLTANSDAGLRGFTKNGDLTGYVVNGSEIVSLSVSGTVATLANNNIGFAGSFNVNTMVGSTRRQRAGAFGRYLTPTQVNAFNAALEIFFS